MFSFLAGLIFLVGFAAHIALTSKYVLTQRSFGNEVPRNTLRWNALYGIALLSLSVWGSLLGIIGLIIALPLTTLLISYYRRFVLKETDESAPDIPQKDKKAK